MQQNNKHVNLPTEQVLDDAYIKKEKFYILLMFLGIFLIAIIGVGLIAFVTFVPQTHSLPTKSSHK